KPAHLQQQLGIRIVRVWIVRNQFDVFLERVFSVRILLILSIRVTENVEGSGIVGCDLRRLFIVSDGLIEVLLAKVITAEIEVCTLVVWISSNEFFEDLFLLGRISIGSGFIRLNQHPFTI